MRCANRSSASSKDPPARVSSRMRLNSLDSGFSMSRETVRIASMMPKPDCIETAIICSALGSWRLNFSRRLVARRPTQISPISTTKIPTTKPAGGKPVRNPVSAAPASAAVNSISAYSPTLIGTSPCSRDLARRSAQLKRPSSEAICALEERLSSRRSSAPTVESALSRRRAPRR